ncbi:MAG: hypothetical protein K2P08_04610 [Oscillospiraceae bacterium]|nr:hypothetical protein [Oscillospiraceae bacterium]
MKRYKQANEGIHAPEELKERAARPGARRPYSQWMGAVAAVLAVAVIGGIAMWPGQGGQPMQLAGYNDPAEGAEPSGSPAAGPAQFRATPGDGETCGSDGVPASYEIYALALADEPEMAPYPKDEDFYSDLGDGEDAWKKASDAYSKAYDAWSESRKALRSGTDYTGVMDGFITSTSAQFLAEAGEENRIYSPINVYMALAMLAETAGGDSRGQILDLLEADSIEALRERANALWLDNYRDDGVVTSLLANSLWLRDGMTYSQQTLDTLAKVYFASSFSGQMGSEAYNQALRDWLNAQTNGLLQEQAQGLEMSPETVLALASTIYFRAAWDDEFRKERTETDTFHAPSGDVDADFMHKTLESSFYWGDNFTAVQLRFQRGGSMWLILPDEGCSVDGLLESGEAMDFLLAPKYDRYDDKGNVTQEGWTGQKFLNINLSMPRFDVSSDLDLIDGLKELGVTDIFDPAVSNFDPLGASTDDPLYVSQAKHAARVKVDEEGCEAAAYTVIIMNAGAAMPPDDEVDFTLDRPFLFAVAGDSGLPLFTGVVNQP